MKKELYKYFKDYQKYCDKYDYDLGFNGFMLWFENHVMGIDRDDLYEK